MHQDRPLKRARAAAADTKLGVSSAKSGAHAVQQALAAFWGNDIPAILNTRTTSPSAGTCKMHFNMERILRHFALDIVSIFPSISTEAPEVGTQFARYIADTCSEPPGDASSLSHAEHEPG